MILTDIGEVGVHLDGRDVVLRPSLYAMSKIGNGKEIVETFSILMTPSATVDAAKVQLQAALMVLYCCTEEDVTDVFGYWGEEGFVPGMVPTVNLVVLARCLMRHGVTGALAPLPVRPEDDGPEFVGEFDVRAMVAMCMAHLSMGERDAWNSTMTSIVGALRAKFPPPPSKAPGAARAPSREEYDDIRLWLDKIEAKRRKRSGVH